MDKKNPSRIKNSTLVGISVLTGCIELVIVFGALILGLWLGEKFGQRGTIVVCLVTLSAPIGLLTALAAALNIMKWLRAQNPASDETNNEEDIT